MTASPSCKPQTVKAASSASNGQGIKEILSLGRVGTLAAIGLLTFLSCPFLRSLTFVRREITYSGTFEPQGNAYLAIYGWTTNPLVEYYIIESYGDHHPSDNPEAKIKGNVSSDGGEYEIMTKRRTNKPSIVGTASFDQYWSIRHEKRVGGTVTTGNHFKAWESVGLKMGRHNYMIVAVEGQDSSGNATVTVGVPPAPAATGTV